MVFSIVFQANTGKKLRGKKIMEEITGPVNLMLNIPLLWLIWLGSGIIYSTHFVIISV